MLEVIFPPYLGAGAKGPGVAALHVLLHLAELGAGLKFDNFYGPATVRAVKRLQVDLGLESNDVDGEFGPKTRAAYKKRYRVSPEVRVRRLLEGTTTWVDPRRPRLRQGWRVKIRHL